MEHVGIEPGVKENGKRTRDKLKNHPYWEECKASEFISCMRYMRKHFMVLHV